MDNHTPNDEQQAQIDAETARLPVSLKDALDRAEAIMDKLAPDAFADPNVVPDWSPLTDDERVILTLTIKGMEANDRASRYAAKLLMAKLFGDGDSQSDMLASMLGMGTDTPQIPRNDGNA